MKPHSATYRFLVQVLLVLGVAASSAAARAQAPVAGKDYVEIPNGQPLEPAAGMVVVEEFFNYICPGCNAFEPVFAPWTQQLPSYVKLVHVPASFRPDFVQYARAYYAAEALGVVEKTHQAVYNAIHISHVIPAEGDRPDEAKIAEFYSGFGVKASDFLAAMQSFGVNAKVRRADELMKRSRIPSTPSVVINGRYLVRGATNGDSLRIATYLIEQEHQR
jgi:protein dithiol oxidoreductase (disulfide-forming)